MYEPDAVSSVSPEKNESSEKLGKLDLRLFSDPDHANARRFASYDDFEESAVTAKSP